MSYQSNNNKINQETCARRVFSLVEIWPHKLQLTSLDWLLSFDLSTKQQQQIRLLIYCRNLFVFVMQCVNTFRFLSRRSHTHRSNLTLSFHLLCFCIQLCTQLSLICSLNDDASSSAFVFVVPIKFDMKN